MSNRIKENRKPVFNTRDDKDNGLPLGQSRIRPMNIDKTEKRGQKRVGKNKKKK